MASELGNIAVSLFSETATITSVLAPIFFLAKAVYSNVLGSTEDHLENIKSLISYFVIIKGMEFLLPYIMEYPYLLHDFMTAKADSDLNKMVNNSITGISQGMANYIKILNWLTEVIYVFGEAMMNLAFYLLAVMGPVIILLSVMAGLGIGIKLYISVLFICASWPIIFAGIDMFTIKFLMENEGIANLAGGLLAAIMKIIGPMGLLMTGLKSPAMGKIFGAATSAIGNRQFGGSSNNQNNKGSNDPAFEQAQAAKYEKYKADTVKAHQEGRFNSGSENKSTPMSRASSDAINKKGPENKRKEPESFKKPVDINKNKDLPKKNELPKTNSEKNKNDIPKSSSSLSSDSGGSYSESVPSHSESSSIGSSNIGSYDGGSNSAGNPDYSSATPKEEMDFESMGPRDANVFARTGKSNLSDDELRKAGSTFADKESASRIDADQWKARRGPDAKADYTNANDYRRAKDSIRHELQRRQNDRQKSSSNENQEDDFQSGHLEKRKKS